MGIKISPGVTEPLKKQSEKRRSTFIGTALLPTAGIGLTLSRRCFRVHGDTLLNILSDSVTPASQPLLFTPFAVTLSLRIRNCRPCVEIWDNHPARAAESYRAYHGILFLLSHSRSRHYIQVFHFRSNAHGTCCGSHNPPAFSCREPCALSCFLCSSSRFCPMSGSLRIRRSS